jgi:titin
LYTFTAVQDSSKHCTTSFVLRSCVVSGLTDGSAYTFTSRAQLATWQTAASAPSNSVTPAAAPDAPTALVATPGNASASIAFTPGADGGAAITNYEYKLDDGSWTAMSPSVTSSPIAITGLTNGTSYAIRLRALNSAGAGAQSDAVSVTPAAAPDAPTALVATPGNASASIAFTPGASNGAAITNYEYKLGDGSWTAMSPSVTSSPIAIAGLTNGTSYAIRLRALNTAGAGAQSDAVNVTPVDPTPTPTPTPKPSNRFVLSPVAASSSALQSVIVTSNPGTATQRGTFNSPSTARSAKRVTACADSKKITKAGRYKLTCELTSAARSARRRGAIRVTLTTTFKPTGGTARSVARTITLKKTSSGITG